MTSEANTEEDLDLNFSSENANTNEEQIRIEAWLDEHPDFFQEYLIRKGKHLHDYFNIPYLLTVMLNEY